ncbi:MAG: HEAT repeat domain-containing protein [Gemmataceae bacterium]|nr:HEAT repeat domain-containing protein [Gemmataceae bacterium]
MIRFSLPCLLWLSIANAFAGPLTFDRGEHICLIGNTLADRMQHSGWLEPLIHARFADRELVFRNLGYSGDELHLRLRSADFGTPDQWLTRCRADVIFAFFGYNESWAGEQGLPTFRQRLDDWIRHTLSQKYNGQKPPKLILFSPIAFENHRSPHLPDGVEANRRLEMYTQAMREVASDRGVRFVDLFRPTRELFERSGERLTINGIHLNERGDRAVAEIIYRDLFAEGPNFPANQLDNLRQAVNEKNFYWFNRYRTVDRYSIYGGRADLQFVNGQTNREVMQRELEVLDVMTANRDVVVWAAAQGRRVEPDDSNTPPFIPVITNKPGSLPDGKHAFLSGEEAISRMTVGSGLKVNLFASEEQWPELVNPVQMAFDTRGRLWVAVWPTYPHWKPKEPMNDKLLILEDTNGDGKADKMTVFADNLHCPTGFEFYNGGVLVAQAPDLLFLKDTNGDDKADLRERVLHCLDSADTHHTANSFVFDPGGALYFQEGTFHHTQVETPYGPPVRVANGAVFRYEPRTHKFDVYVTFGFANPHGHVFDRWGQDIVIDGTGAQPYHAPLFSGYLPFPEKHARPPQVYQQRTRPSGGMEILSSRHFPPEFEGNLIVTNCIGFQGLLRYKITDQGASFAGQELEPILYSSDPNFRPVDCKTGPDGALYFLDWHNPIIGHMQHNLRDPSRDREHGRIYRVTYDNRPLSESPRIAGEPIDRLIELLKHPEDRVRYRTRIELASRPTEPTLSAARKKLEQASPSKDGGNEEFEHFRLEVLWLHQSHNVVNVELLREVLNSPDFRARSAAVRVLCEWRDRVPQALGLLRSAVNDQHPRVRLEAVRAASYFPAADVLPVLIEVLTHPDDPFVSHVFRETLRAIELQTKVRTQGSIARAMVKLLTSGNVPVERRAAYVEAICRQGDAEDLRAVWDAVAIREDAPVELRRRTLEQLADAAQTRKVRPAGTVDLTSLLAHRDTWIRATAARLAGLWEMTQVVAEIRRLAADESEPDLVRRASAQALGYFGDAETRTLLESLGQTARPSNVRFQAIASLARSQPATAAGLAAKALAQARPTDDLTLLFDPFLTRKGGLDQLAGAIEKSPPPQDQAKLALRSLYAAGRSDAPLIDVLTKAAGLSIESKPPTSDEVRELVNEVMSKGDPARGEAIFRRADLGCFKCHAVNKAGGNVGPELTALGGSSPVDYVVTSVLDPNAAVKEQYATRTITTAEGQVFTGILVSRDQQRVVLRDATGKRIDIPVADIDEEREGKSLMPEGLTKFLTRQELLDLCRFLSELGRPGPYAVPTAATIQRWQVWRPTASDLESVGLSDNAEIRKIQSLPVSSWETTYGMVSGHLPLSELHQPDKGNVVYLRGEFEMDVPGSVRINISGPRQAIWVDGQKMPDQWDGLVRVEGGRHSVILRVRTADDPQAKIRVELSQPVGAVGRFEIVNGP